jgi:hypothetical protein
MLIWSLYNPSLNNSIGAPSSGHSEIYCIFDRRPCVAVVFFQPRTMVPLIIVCLFEVVVARELRYRNKSNFGSQYTASSCVWRHADTVDFDSSMFGGGSSAMDWCFARKYIHPGAAKR